MDRRLGLAIDSRLAATISSVDKGKPDQSQGRKATGPRFLRDAFCYAPKDPKIAGLPDQIQQRHREDIGMYRTLVFVTAALIAGCATTGSETVVNLPDGHRILVVSTLGDSLNVQHTGTTMFGNWQQAEDVATWKVDDRVEQMIREELEENSRFEVVAADIAESRNSLGHAVRGPYSSKPLKEGPLSQLLSLARSANADSVLLVGTAFVEDYFFSTNQYLEGYGVYQRTAFNQKSAIAYAIVHLWLIDVASRDQIARTSEHGQRPRAQSSWVEKDESMSDEDLQYLRESITDMLNAVTKVAMTELALVPE